MTENLAGDPALPDPYRHLTRTRWAAYFVSFFLLVIVAGSLVLFVYQFRAPLDPFNPYGARYRDQPGAWLHLFEHLVRMSIGCWLLVCAWRYLRAIRGSTGKAQLGMERIFAAVSSGWAALGWSAVALLGMSLLNLIQMTYGLPSLPFWSGSEPDRFRGRIIDEPPRAITFEFREAQFEPGDGLTESVMEINELVRKAVYLGQSPIVETSDIIQAKPAVDQNGNPALELYLSKQGESKLMAATRSLIGKQLAILIDGKVHSVPIVNSPLGANVMITGSFSKERVREMADSLNANR